MSGTVIWDGQTIDPALLRDYGFNDLINYGGVQLPRFLSYLQAGINQANLSISQSAQGYVATSTTSLNFGAGAFSLTTQPGKAFSPGITVAVFRTSQPNTAYMLGTVTSYNTTTGALAFTVEASDFVGSGTFNDWTIALAGRRGIEGSVWLSGNGTPNNANGRDGDYYFRTATGDIFLKTGGAWGSPIANIRGPQGIQGIQGPTGPVGGGSLAITRIDNAAGGETTVTLAYTPPNIIVVKNGAVLQPTEYTATNGTSVTLAVALSAGDTLLALGLQAIALAGGGVPPERAIVTANSLRGGGDLTNSRTLDLVGDVASPGPNRVYGTDANGNRGWRDAGISSQTVSANTNASVNIRYFCNTSTTAFTLTLPASPSVGDLIGIVDRNSTFFPNALTIARNGNTIDGLAEDLIADLSGAAFDLVWTGTTWRLM